MKCTISKSLSAALLLCSISFGSFAQNTHKDKIEAQWLSLLPNLSITQYAGNIGFISTGIGWDYGKNDRWETHFLIGYLPKFTFADDSFTLTLREQFLPWQTSINDWLSITPATFGLSLNAVLNDEFWFTEPVNNDYYRFSSKVRFHLGLGSRFNVQLPNEKKRRFSRISFYYELSTYDLAVISYVRTRQEPLHKILSLGVGVNFTIF